MRLDFKDETCDGQACLEETEDCTEFHLFLRSCDSTLIGEIAKWMDNMNQIVSMEDLVDTTYETLDPHGFDWALTCLKHGLKVYRAGWNGKGMWLALQVPDEHSKMNRPYIYMKAVNDELVPWVASQSDLLADDWKVRE